MITDKILAKCSEYIKAKITEIQVNQGWTNRQYMLDMIHYTGWYFGAEWCAASAALVWLKCYESDINTYNVVKKLISLNCQEMGRNFHNDQKWPTNTKTPKLGAIAIWGDGDSLVRGHCGIVVLINGKQFVTAEGNTSSVLFPETRTGWTYSTHTHTVGLPHSKTGLNLIRFIYPLETY